MDKTSMQMAVDAKVIATRALTQIVAHEKECAERWGLAARLGSFIAFQMVALLGLLLADKLGWFQ